MSENEKRAEYILRVKKREIEELKNTLRAKDQIIQMLEAFILEGVEQKGRVEISKTEIAKGLKNGCNIEVTEEKYILTKKE